MAISLVRGAINTTINVIIGLYLTIKERILKFFRPKPLESEIDNPNYFNQTELKEKLYDKEDGEYVSFREIK
ncbi:MAG: hypothetical protein IJS20_05405 [Bacteroidales bacterium]|nr:hypothetical protein [Bacteroidales bacterium]